MFAQSAVSSPASQSVVDTITVYDTIHRVLVDTVHVQVSDTLGVVLAPVESLWGKLLSVLVVVASVAAAIAAWRAATASEVNAAAAIATADAASKQAEVAAQQAKVQLEQFTTAREAAKLATQRTAQSLKALALRVRAPLNQLTVPGPLHHQLRSYSWLAEADIQQLEELSRSVSAEAISVAGKAAVSLRAIAAMIDTAKTITLGTGWVPTTKESENWETALKAAEKRLSELEYMCEQIAES